MGCGKGGLGGGGGLRVVPVVRGEQRATDGRAGFHRCVGCGRPGQDPACCSEVPGLQQACEAALLPHTSQGAVRAWASEMGAATAAELLKHDRYAALTAAAGLKPLQAERLQEQLRALTGSPSKAVDAAGAAGALAGGGDQSLTNGGTPLGSVSAIGGSCSFGTTEEKRVPRHIQKKQSEYSESQLKGRPRRIVFVRHGESEANVDRQITAWIPDHELHLTPAGRQQALDAGLRLRAVLGDSSSNTTFVVSPYVRTRETLNGILRAWDGEKRPQVTADVRIREQEYGNFDRSDMRELHEEKSAFGAFYYRFPDGESPADCYDRASIFLESLYRTWADNTHENYVIVSHGMMIIVMLMRLLWYPVEQFDTLDSLHNCELVVLERSASGLEYQIAYTWAGGAEKDFAGLRVKNPDKTAPVIWDGNPEEEPYASRVRASRIDVINRARCRGVSVGG